MAPFPTVIVSRILHANPSQATKPTRTLPQAITRVLTARQAVTTTTTVVTESSGGNSNGLSGGAIAGIVIGSIAGFLLLLWIIRSCMNLGHPGIWGSTFDSDREKPSQPPAAYYANGDPYRHRSHHSHHSRGPRRVSVVSATQPVVYEQQRGRSPQAPPAAYYGRTSYDGRDVRRSSDARRHRNY
ncbi:hypothetical protein F5Y19DRAFT_350050 [Xylariaceae sp. FL1651]|nr:hypothetical protein F5Y19DRAFT_350050 [Xylariaceae sp. FL1651]